MANKDITRSNGHQNKFAGASTDVLAAVINTRATEMIAKLHSAECVARGGEKWANSLDLDGDPIDSVSGGIFGSIVSSMEDASAQIDLLAAINELWSIAGKSPSVSA